MQNHWVIVAGGGISGCFAALSASRAGAKVYLVENTDTLGGICVEGPLEAFMTFHDEEGSISTPMTEEFLSRLIREGGSPGYIEDTTGYCKTIVPYDAEILRKVLFALLHEQDIAVFLNSSIVGAFTENQRIRAVIVNYKGKETVIEASAFVDATGDGDLAYNAGASVMMGREGDRKVQPMTLLFLVSGVDTKKFKEYIFANPDKFKMNWDIVARNPDILLHLWGFHDILAKGYREGRLSLLRNELQAMECIHPGSFVINYTRFSGDPLSAEIISRAQEECLKQAHELVEYFRLVIPGFSHAYIARTGKIGIRESRRIVGKYILQDNDILYARDFKDAVARGAFPIDIHQPDGDSLANKTISKAYSIPASCLSSKDFSNLFMSGRCISASHEAMASTRISATAMATGQAAGVLAAVVAENYESDFTNVIALMRKIGAI